MTKSRDRLPDGLSPLKHSFQVRPSVAIAGTISPTAYAQTPDAQTSDSVTLSSTAQSLLSNSPSTTSNSTEPTPAEVALQTLQAGAASDSANIALQTLKSINKALHDAQANSSGSGVTANGVTNALSQTVPVGL
jgi:hypothetical protein